MPELARRGSLRAGGHRSASVAFSSRAAHAEHSERTRQTDLQSNIVWVATSGLSPDTQSIAKRRHLDGFFGNLPERPSSNHRAAVRLRVQLAADVPARVGTLAIFNSGPASRERTLTRHLTLLSRSGGWLRHGVRHVRASGVRRGCCRLAHDAAHGSALRRDARARAGRIRVRPAAEQCGRSRERLRPAATVRAASRDAYRPVRQPALTRVQFGVAAVAS